VRGVAQQSLRPGHPEYANVLVEKRALLAQIDEELARIKANARSELELAQSNEGALTGELKSLETRTAAGNQAQVRLRELQREAQAARAIFEQFLNRAKETSEQETLGRENSRIISAATVPPYPAFPPTLLILAGALLAGLVAGIGTAWLAHLLSGPADAAAAAIPASAPPAAGAGPPPPHRAGVCASCWRHWHSRSRWSRSRASRRPISADAAPSSPPPCPAGGAAVIETWRGAAIAYIRPPGREQVSPTPDLATTLPPSTTHGHRLSGYREVIDQILQSGRARGGAGKPTICLLVGTEAGRRHLEQPPRADLPLRDQRRRTLLIDACASIRT
jgi:hypothetical protein